MNGGADDRQPKSPPWSHLPEPSSSVSPGLLDLQCKRSCLLVFSSSSSIHTMSEIGLISILNRTLSPRWLCCLQTSNVQMGNSFGLDIISLLPRSLKTVRIPVTSMDHTDVQSVDLALLLNLSRTSPSPSQGCDDMY